MDTEQRSTAHGQGVLSFVVSMLLIPSFFLLFYLAMAVVGPWVADLLGVHPEWARSDLIRVAIW